MGVLATAYRHMCAAGMAQDAIATALEEMEAAMTPTRSTAAERQKRYRERKAQQKSVTRDVTSVTTLRSDVTPLPLSPSKEIPPTPPKETQPLSLTVVTARATSNEVSKDEEWELIASAGKALSASPSLFVMSEPMKWKAAGMDWLRDVLPTIRALSAKCPPGSIKTWKYFTQAIADSHAKRTTPMPEGKVSHNGQQRRSTAAIARELANTFRERERGDDGSFETAGVVSRAG